MENEKYLVDWHETRKNGRKRFALSHGTIFGCITLALHLVYLGFSGTISAVLTPAIFLFQLAVWVIGGILGHATIMWWVNEYLYKTRFREEAK